MTRPGLNALKIAARKMAVVAAPFLVLHLVEYGYLKHNIDLSSYSDEDIEAAIEARPTAPPWVERPRASAQLATAAQA